MNKPTCASRMIPQDLVRAVAIANRAGAATASPLLRGRPDRVCRLSRRDACTKVLRSRHELACESS